VMIDRHIKSLNLSLILGVCDVFKPSRLTLCTRVIVPVIVD